MDMGWLLRRGMGGPLAWPRSLEREERLENALADLVQLGLQFVQVLVQAVLDHFVHPGKGEVRAELAQEFLRGMAEGAQRRAADGVKRIAGGEQAELDGARKLPVEHQEVHADIKGQRITAPTAAALAGKLLQFTSGSVYDEQGEAHEVHRSKLEYLESIMEESSSPTLVFYHFKHALQKLRLAFPEAVVLDDDNIEAWRNVKIRMLLAHPQSGGIGLNLQCNVGDTAQTVWYDIPWSSENYIQANARIYRQGQEKPVIIHHLTVTKSIDEQVVKVLEGKINLQEALLDSLVL